DQTHPGCDQNRGLRAIIRAAGTGVAAVHLSRAERATQRANRSLPQSNYRPPEANAGASRRQTHLGVLNMSDRIGHPGHDTSHVASVPGFETKTLPAPSFNIS